MTTAVIGATGRVAARSSAASWRAATRSPRSFATPARPGAPSANPVG
jgi:hypothetical protein